MNKLIFLLTLIIVLASCNETEQDRQKSIQLGNAAFELWQSDSSEYQIENVVRLYKESLKYDSLNITSLSNLAMIQNQKGDMVSALKLTRRLYKHLGYDSIDFEMYKHTNLGMYYEKKSSIDSAKMHYTVSSKIAKKQFLRYKNTAKKRFYFDALSVSLVLLNGKDSAILKLSEYETMFDKEEYEVILLSLREQNRKDLLDESY